MKNLICALAFVLISTVLSMPAAHADNITLKIINPVQSIGPQGGTLYYQATASAPITNSGMVYLNADSFSLNTSFTLDDSPFLLNFPSSLDPGDTYTGTLFDVMIPANSPIGVDVGSFQIQGGATDSAQSVLGNADFDIVVTPEPPSLLLLGTGSLIMAIMCRRVRFSVARNQKMIA